MKKLCSGIYEYATYCLKNVQVKDKMHLQYNIVFQEFRICVFAANFWKNILEDTCTLHLRKEFVFKNFLTAFTV